MPKKILVVEDNEKNRIMIRDLLEHHGYEMLEAEDGEQGIHLAKEQRPDLIILDMQMPVMDGFAAAKVLKSDPETKDIKIIAVTSYAMKGDRERILAVGVDEYLAKPIDTRQLPVLVKRILG